MQGNWNYSIASTFYLVLAKHIWEALIIIFLLLFLLLFDFNTSNIYITESLKAQNSSSVKKFMTVGVGLSVMQLNIKIERFSDEASTLKLKKS